MHIEIRIIKQRGMKVQSETTTGMSSKGFEQGKVRVFTESSLLVSERDDVEYDRNAVSGYQLVGESSFKKKPLHRGYAPDEVFKKSTITIDLTSLVSVKDVIYPDTYDKDTRCCAVIIQIIDEKIQEAYGQKEYILQLYWQQRRVFQISLKYQPEVCSFLEETVFCFITHPNENGIGERQLYSVQANNYSIDRVHIVEVSSSLEILDIGLTDDRTMLKIVNSLGVVNVPYENLLQGNGIRRLCDQPKKQNKIWGSIDEQIEGQLFKHQDGRYFGLSRGQLSLVFVEFNESELSGFKQYCIGESKIVKMVAVALDKSNDFLTVLIREDGTFELMRGFEKIFDNYSEIRIFDPMSVRGMIEHELKHLKKLKFDDVILSKDNLYLKTFSGQLHQYCIQRLVPPQQILKAVKLSHKAKHWKNLNLREAQAWAGVGTLLFTDMVLEDSSIRLIFDSVLITLDLFYPVISADGEKGPPYSVKRVDRFDYDLYDIVNYDHNEKGESNLSFDSKKTGMQLLGTSKLTEPFYDWDFVNRQVGLLNAKPHGIDHVLIIFTDDSYERQRGIDVPTIQIVEFKGEVVQRFTHKFKDQLHSIIKVRSKDRQIQILSDLKRVPEELKYFKPIFQKNDATMILTIYTENTSEVFLGVAKVEKSLVTVINSEGNEMRKIDINRDAWTKICKKNPFAIIEPSFDDQIKIILVAGMIYTYDMRTETLVRKVDNPAITEATICVVDSKYLYLMSGNKGLQLLNTANILSSKKNIDAPVVTVHESDEMTSLQYFVQYKRLSAFHRQNTLVRIYPLSHSPVTTPVGFNYFSESFEKRQILERRIDKTLAGQDILTAVDSRLNYRYWDQRTGLQLRYAKPKNANKFSGSIPRSLRSSIASVHGLKVTSEEEGNKKLTYFKSLLDIGYQIYYDTNVHSMKRNNDDPVLYLMNYQDPREGDSRQKFKIAEYIDTSKVQERTGDIICTFLIELQSNNDKLFFDSSFTRMLHIELNQDKAEFKQATLYKLVFDQGIELEPTRAELEIVRVFTDLQWDCQNSQLDNLISPNFQYFIDYNEGAETYEIAHLEDDCLKNIVLKEKNEVQDDSPDYVFSPKTQILKMIWITDYLIIDYSEPQLYRAMEIVNGKLKTYLIYNLTPSNFDKEIYSMLAEEFVRVQVIRKMSTPQRSIEVGKCLREELFDRGDSVYIRHSYTYYHWLLTRKIIQENDPALIDVLSEDDLQLLLLNQFPTKSYTKSTFLHMISLPDELEENSMKKSFRSKSENSKSQWVSRSTVFDNQILKRIFEKLYPPMEGDSDEKRMFTYHFPYIQNFKLKSSDFDKGVCPLNLMLKRKNSQGITVLLQYLKYHPVAYHSSEISNVLPALLNRPSIIRVLAEYLDSRLIEAATHLGRENSLYTIDADNFSALFERKYQLNPILELPTWTNILNKAANVNDSPAFIANETNIRVELLDISLPTGFDEPYMLRLYKAISNVDDYINLNVRRSVQVLIDDRWNTVFRYILGSLFLPFLLYQATFVVYSNVYTGQVDINYQPVYPDEDNGFIALSVILYVLSFYFLLHEMLQFYQIKWEYFTKSFIWNVVDVIPPMLVVTVVTVKLLQKYDTTTTLYILPFINSVHAFASMSMWFKFFYFLRIFDKTSYLIRIIIYTYWEMKTFLMILLIMYFAFGEAFLRLSEASDPNGDGQFLNNIFFSTIYAYRLSVGDNDTSAYDGISQPIAAWLLFIACGVSVNIVMLNLLISIIGNSFAEMNEVAEATKFKERADLIDDNAYLLQWPFKQINRFCSSGKHSRHMMSNWLLVLTDVTDEQMPTDDGTNQIKNAQDTIVGSITEKCSDLDEKLSALERKITAMDENYKASQDAIMQVITDIKSSLTGIKQ